MIWTLPCRFIVSLILAVAMLTCLSGCLGSHARSSVGAPALALAMDGVHADAAVGVSLLTAEEQPQAASDLTAFSVAVSSKDPAQVQASALPRWPQVRAWAANGIDHQQAAGKIGSAAANSKRERLKNFGEVLTKVGTTQ